MTLCLWRLRSGLPGWTLRAFSVTVCPSLSGPQQIPVRSGCGTWKTPFRHLPLLPHFPHSRRVNFHLESRNEHYCRDPDPTANETNRASTVATQSNANGPIFTMHIHVTSIRRSKVGGWEELCGS